jgi:hypothetical protein
MSDAQKNTSSLRLVYLVTLAACLVPSISRAQQITHVDFEVTGSTVKISYDVTACSGNEDFDVRLLLGQDGDLTEIKRGLSGDLEHVACESSNIILWDVLTDREELKGPIFFAVEILRTHPIVAEESPIAFESDDGKPAGAVPHGDQKAIDPPDQSAYVAPPRFFQVAPWIALELARVALLSSGYRGIVLPKKHISPAPSRRHR